MPHTQQRTFNGKKYSHHFNFNKKTSAQKVAKGLKKGGAGKTLVRVTRTRLSDGRRGWAVWTRRVTAPRRNVQRRRK